MMLSRWRGEAWAAPESDYSKSRPKGHCQPWARLRKSSGNGPDRQPCGGPRSRDETILPATKHFCACDDKFPKPSPRSSLFQRGATPARELGRSIRCHTIRKRGHSMAFNASTVRACKMLIATTFALAALSTGAQAYTPEQEQMCTGDAMRLCSSEIPD